MLTCTRYRGGAARYVRTDTPSLERVLEQAMLPTHRHWSAVAENLTKVLSGRALAGGDRADTPDGADDAVDADIDLDKLTEPLRSYYMYVHLEHTIMPKCPAAFFYLPQARAFDGRERILEAMVMLLLHPFTTCLLLHRTAGTMLRTHLIPRHAVEIKGTGITRRSSEGPRSLCSTTLRQGKYRTCAAKQGSPLVCGLLRAANASLLYRCLS